LSSSEADYEAAAVEVVCRDVSVHKESRERERRLVVQYKESVVSASSEVSLSDSLVSRQLTQAKKCICLLKYKVAYLFSTVASL
jgi:hypothetical protein